MATAKTNKVEIELEKAEDVQEEKKDFDISPYLLNVTDLSVIAQFFELAFEQGKVATANNAEVIGRTYNKVNTLLQILNQAAQQQAVENTEKEKPVEDQAKELIEAAKGE